MEPNSLFIFSVFTAFMMGSTSNDRAVMTAYYKQSGLESTARDFEQRNVSKEVRVYLGHTAFISKTILERKIVFQWTF